MNSRNVSTTQIFSLQFIYVQELDNHDTSRWCWSNAGPSSETLAQHLNQHRVNLTRDGRSGNSFSRIRLSVAKVFFICPCADVHPLLRWQWRSNNIIVSFQIILTWLIWWYDEIRSRRLYDYNRLEAKYTIFIEQSLIQIPNCCYGDYWGWLLSCLVVNFILFIYFNLIKFPVSNSESIYINER